jgi:DNA-binding transcriptional MerR regulator
MDGADAGRLTSGEMSRRSGLSPKALRIYHANGLLRPARVDEDTGYRTYRPEQVERGRAIALLRRIGMPLARIAEVVDATGDDARALVLGWQSERAQALSADSEALDELTSRVAPTADTASVLRRDVVERTVATRTSTVHQASLVPTFTGDVLALRAHLAAQGAEFGDEYWVLYHSPVAPDVLGQIETCVPYTGAASPAGDVVLRAEPAGEELYVPVSAARCRYPDILLAFTAVHARAAEVGGAVRPPREIYPVPWRDDDPDAVVAEVALSVGVVP